MKTILFFLFLLICTTTFGQITTTPSFPVTSQSVTITFNSAEDSQLEYYTGDLYAHTGVMIEGNSEWQHVIGNWGDNTAQPKLTNNGNGIYELEITPDILSFYSVTDGEKVTKLCFVFRSADGSSQTNDLFVAIYENEFSVTISSHSDQQMIEKATTDSIKAVCSAEANLVLKFDETILSEKTGTSIATQHTFNESGWHWLIAQAAADENTVYDSVQVYVTHEVITEAKPDAYLQGINYLSDDSVALVLWAPGKENVYVIGDFNNWQPDENYLMKQDGDYFWLEISNLTAGKEYIFQYLIDGDIRIGDPYCDKVSDPYNDDEISNDVYPDLIEYPNGKTTGRASVLQTAQDEYSWQTSSVEVPANEDLVIYELLIRDFTDEGTYKAVIEKLDYLEQLGVNAIELMPFNEFEGNSSWGYNPNYYFAPDKAYGPKNDLKMLIDSCHQRGMLVIQDMVLNHAYNSCPMVKMYWDDANDRPAASNPWFNVTSPNTAYSWGSDFNHESAATQNFVDSVTSYWINEYRVDGFRFDFTKGFTNTTGDGSAYDASRITILKRMSNHIWSVKNNAKVILEHFAENSEEKELSADGMMIWGNGNYNFNEATMGYNESSKSDFSGSSYQDRGWTKPNLVAYMESHDEERLMYKNLQYGNSGSSYNVKILSTALERCELAATFFFSLAGPKMIWQFGELGYDYSIDENGRTGEKPVKWEYLDDTDRKDLFNVYATMIKLRRKFDVFTSGTETLNLGDAGKTILLTKNDTNVVVVGNFGVESATISINFPQTGTWNEFFSEKTLSVSSTPASLTLEPGEYRLYSNVELSLKDTGNADSTISSQNVILYPNPVSSNFYLASKQEIQRVEIYSVSGQLIQTEQQPENQKEINVSDLVPGVYIVRAFQDDAVVTKKMIVK